MTHGLAPAWRMDCPTATLCNLSGARQGALAAEKDQHERQEQQSQHEPRAREARSPVLPELRLRSIAAVATLRWLADPVVVEIGHPCTVTSIDQVAAGPRSELAAQQVQRQLECILDRVRLLGVTRPS